MRQRRDKAGPQSTDNTDRRDIPREAWLRDYPHLTDARPGVPRSRDAKTTSTGSDDRPGIPRDANGDPIFLILPDGVRAKYEARLADCEAAWWEGEPLAVGEATSWAHMHRQPIPAWLEQAIVELAMARRSDAQAKRHVEAGVHLVRYMTVRNLKVGTPVGAGAPGQPGRYIPPPVYMTWDEARDKAAEMLAGTPAAGSADTMKSSYAIVKRDLKARHAGKYFTLKDRRYRHNGRPPLG